MAGRKRVSLAGRKVVALKGLPPMPGESEEARQAREYREEKLKSAIDADATKSKAKTTAAAKVKIKPPNMQIGKALIRGLTPYVQNRMSSENREKMQQKQEEGSAKGRVKRAKPPKDFDRVYKGSMHVSRQGWYGIPSGGLRQAMIDACRLTEMDMTRAKMCLDVIADGLDKENSEPLTKITSGEPRMFIDRVRVGISQTDLAARAMFEEWEAVVTLEWDADIFDAEDVINLLARAGLQVGIGAGRKLSKNSGGTGKGKFEVVPM